jgi:ribosomal protein S18 acetylase RimI-like enzyme
MIAIVEFKSGDIDTVFEIQKAAYRPLYEKYHDDATNPYMESKEKVLEKYTREGTRGYIFVENGVAVGAVRIALHPESKSGRVSALGVHPRFQGRGIAQRALLKIEEMHPEIEVWTLDTILEEAGNCHLYEKLGYRKTGKLEKLGDNMTLVFYEKK